MAKIKFGAIVTDGRGKLGGHVLSKNRAGAYMRTKVTPVNPRSQFQTGVRAIFGLITAGWSALTNPQILAWNGAVSDWQTTDIFGDLVKPTGKNLHQRLNQVAIANGFPAMTTPPAKEVLPEDIITGAAIAIGAETITLTGLPVAGAFNVLFSATPAMSQGTSFVKNRIRNVESTIVTGVTAGGLFDAYEARFGTPEVGQNIHVGVQYVLATGQITPMQTLKATITA